MEPRVLLFLVTILGSLAQEDLEGKVFVFPMEASTDHVILNLTITEPLQKVSVCLNSYSHLARPYSLFSLSTPSSANAFSFFSNSPTYYHVIVNNEYTTYRTDPESMDWRHTCVTWDSSTGVVQLWVNGKLSPRRVSRKGFSIEAETSIVLGQEQASFGGKFDSYKLFLGEMSDVHMWDYVLTPKDIHKVISGGLNGNVISWRSLVYEMKGSVVIQPKLQCRSWGSTSSLYTPCY
ncbi:PREDICTED: C-reactive protein-like [Nanorana parkeri]|uniref:C-reactive protein-like n=1 Tax=Nanorana parkeri TaxID=125878 RepID=UPI000854B9A9|nr:PREDICTED: C-reactive protein-like [Nanorana parkeri]